MLSQVTSQQTLQKALFGWLCACVAVTTHADESFIRNGTMGMVVSFIEYALAPDADLATTCPNGMSLNFQEIYANTSEGKRRDDETDKAYIDRLRNAAKTLSTTETGLNSCMNPEATAPEPNFHTVTGSTTPVFGINLDGQHSAEDFPGVDGDAGIDNQWYRTVGCSRSFQPNGMSVTFNIAMLTGSWGILIELQGVDDLSNDDQVQVSIYANGDPIRLSPGREPLAYASYTPTADQHFKTTVSGRIEDGVLTSEPADVRLYNEVNSMLLERFLRDAQLQLKLADDGSASGYLAGYAPVESVYDMQFGYRSGHKADGSLAPLKLRSGSANGAAFVLGHTCHGVYHALYANADGHPDPQTGRFTSVSMQYRIDTLPAFIVSADSPSEVTGSSIALGGSHVHD